MSLYNDLTTVLTPYANKIKQNESDIGDIQDDLSATNESLSDYSNIGVLVENTNFANRLVGNAREIAYSDSGLNIQKIESLVPYPATGRFISSNGSDSWLFRTPYKNFTFGINKTSSAAYRLSAIPEGTEGELLAIAETLIPTVSGNYNTYTIAQDRGTIILFTKLKAEAYPEKILVTTQNNFQMPGLELNDMQESFLRYSNRTDMSSYMPNMVKLSGKLINTATGGISTNANYDTYYTYCPISSITVKSTNAIRCAITSKAPDEISGSGYLIELKYSNATERVESFTVSYGQYVAFSVSSNVSLDFASDYVKTFTLPSLKLAPTQQRQSFYKFEKSGNNTYLHIYYMSGDKVVRWSLQNTPLASINSNTWQIGPVYGYDFDGSKVSGGVQLVTGGEFELAFRESGSADFCGGINHGDETTDDITILIDGKIISLTDVDSKYHGFDRIVAIEHSTVNRCDTPAEDILKHQKIWTFENGKVKVWQTVKFLEALSCDFLATMLPANRSVFTLGVRQGNYETESMPTSDFSILTTRGNKQMYEMYGANASARVTFSTCDHTPVASMYINNAPTMNKLYVNFYGGAWQTEVPADTVLYWEQEYDIAYN